MRRHEQIFSGGAGTLNSGFGETPKPRADSPHLELVQHDLNEAVLFFLFGLAPLLSLPELFLVRLHHGQLALGRLLSYRNMDR